MASHLVPEKAAMKLASLLLLPILLLATAHAQFPCSPGDAARAAMLPLGLQNKLLGHKIPTEAPEFDAPADVGRDIVMLRKTLDVATQAFFRCEAGSDSSPVSLQSKLSVFLHADQSKRPEFSFQPYGANLTIHMETAKEFPDSLFIVLTFDIECGSDNLLFLYTREGARWHSRLHWYSDKYTGPSDAYGDFVYYKSVPGPDTARPLLALIHGHSQCASVHSGFGMDLVRAAWGSSPQQTLDHLMHSYVIDDEFNVSLTTAGLQIRTSVESEDASRIWHPGILSYSTNSGRLVLLPVALNARDFVDEWLEEPWTTVEKWSESTSLSELQNAHQTSGGVFGPARACRGSKDHFQVELGFDTDAPVYAQVRQNPNSFTMLSITDHPDPTCTGPDLMRTRKP